MIHDEICTYEVCKLAKEKGFNEKCYHYYQKGVLGSDKCFNHYIKGVGSVCSAPTQSLMQRWLREEKGLHIEISVSVNDKHCFYWTLYSKGCDCWEGAGMCYDGYNTYELALEDALKYALENLV